MCTRAVVRSRAAGRGNILARCVLRRLAVAINCSDAFSDALPRQFSRFMHPRRGLGREKRPSLAAYRRCASKTSWLWQDMRAMHPKSAANHRWRIHHAHILPGRGPFRCTDPSDHTWGANLAREPHRTGPPESCMGHESCYRSRLSGKGSDQAKMPTFWQKRTLKKKLSPKALTSF